MSIRSTLGRVFAAIIALIGVLALSPGTASAQRGGDPYYGYGQPYVTYSPTYVSAAWYTYEHELIVSASSYSGAIVTLKGWADFMPFKRTIIVWPGQTAIFRKDVWFGVSLAAEVIDINGAQDYGPIWVHTWSSYDWYDYGYDGPTKDELNSPPLVAEPPVEIGDPYSPVITEEPVVVEQPPAVVMETPVVTDPHAGEAGEFPDTMGEDPAVITTKPDAPPATDAPYNEYPDGFANHEDPAEETPETDDTVTTPPTLDAWVFPHACNSGHLDVSISFGYMAARDTPFEVLTPWDDLRLTLPAGSSDMTVQVDYPADVTEGFDLVISQDSRVLRVPAAQFRCGEYK